MQKLALVMGCGMLAVACAKRAPDAAGAVPSTAAPEADAASSEGPWVTLPCGWEVGQTFHYVQERRRTDTRQPMAAAVSSRTPVTVTVTSMAGDRAVFAYDTGVSELSGPPEVVAAAQETIGDLDMPAMLIVMEAGTVTGVDNHMEIVEAAMGPLARSMGGGASPEVMEKTRAMFEDPNTGPQLLLRDPGKLFAMHCVEVQPDSVIETPMSFPNPFGGPPLSGRSRVEVTGYDADAGQLSVSTLDTTDAEAIKQMVPALLERFAGETIDPEKADEMAAAVAALPPIESRMVGAMVYSVADGFPTRVEVRQDVGAEGHPMHKSDTWIWTRVEAP